MPQISSHNQAILVGLKMFARDKHFIYLTGLSLTNKEHGHLHLFKYVHRSSNILIKIIFAYDA